MSLNQTLEIINKYKTTVAVLLDCKPEQLKLESLVTVETYKDGGCINSSKWVEVGEIYEYKIDIDNDRTDTSTLNFQVGSFQLTLYGRFVSTWRLYQMPHCCAYIVSCNVQIREEFRNKGVGSVLNKLRQEIGKLLGYTSMLCTDIEQNTAQRKLLKKNGWTDIHEIVNKRTKNKVYLSVIDL